MEINDLTNGRPERFEWVLSSEAVEERFRQDYNNKLQKFIENQDVYKLVDCLEEYMDNVYYGNLDRLDGPTTLIPSHHDMIPFPKFVKLIDNPQPIGSLKFGPSDFLNPFKATPITHAMPDMPTQRLKKVYPKKYKRRMRGTPLNRRRFFSTYIGSPAFAINNPLIYLPFTVKK